MSPHRIWRNREVRVLSLSATAAALAIIALLGLLIVRTTNAQQYRRQTADNCAQINLLKSAIREVLNDAERESLRRPGITADQVDFITDYYSRQRMRFADDECIQP